MTLLRSRLIVATACTLASVNCCTTLIVGKAASADGSVMATHSDDAESNPDPRLVRVPAQTYPAGSKRDIFYDTEGFPRFVGNRGVDAYLPSNNPGYNMSIPIGSIPQVEHTFSYFEATYGILNEKQVGIGESTCSAIFGTQARGHGGHALFSIDSLSRIALERSATAREAVQLMGDLAVKEGFYGADAFEGTGESLMVVDPEEGFIFHILPDDTGRSAVWAAQRVPDAHVGVVANMFTIRTLDPNATTAGKADFLFSPTVHAIAKKNGWWSPSDGLLDFTKVYSDGEYAHKYYSGRRMWGAYRMLAPELSIPAEYADLRPQQVYPATTPTTKKLGPRDLMAVHRTFYEGTKYSLTNGVAAGPFGNPDRYATTTQQKGNWERSIALYRTSESHVVQARSWLPDAVGGVMWFGPAAAHGTVYVPFAAGVASLPTQYATGDPGHISRESAYWAHKYTLNVARLRYSDMIADIKVKQDEFESAAWARVANLTASEPLPALTKEMSDFAERVVREWWKLPDYLIQKYADGYLEDAKPLGYPEGWLTMAKYAEGPPQPPAEPKLPHCCNPTTDRYYEHPHQAAVRARGSAFVPQCNGGLRVCISNCGTEADEAAYAQCVQRCSAACSGGVL